MVPVCSQVWQLWQTFSADLLHEGLSTLELDFLENSLNLGANHYLGADQPSIPNWGCKSVPSSVSLTLEYLRITQRVYYNVNSYAWPLEILIQEVWVGLKVFFLMNELLISEVWKVESDYPRERAFWDSVLWK